MRIKDPDGSGGVIMALRKTEKEKKAAQQRRLLSEFPWLFAICNEWYFERYLGWHDIEVHGIDNLSYMDELQRLCLADTKGDEAVWLIQGNLKHIYCNANRVSVLLTDRTFVENIRYDQYYQRNYPVTFIVVVTQPNPAKKNKRLIIYRPQKAIGQLNSMINEIGCYAEGVRRRRDKIPTA